MLDAGCWMLDHFCPGQHLGKPHLFSRRSVAAAGADGSGSDPRQGQRQMHTPDTRCWMLDARSAHPSTQRRKDAEAQRKLSETSSHGEVPGRSTTAGNCCVGKPARKFAFESVSRHGNLRSQRAQASLPLFFIHEKGGEHLPHFSIREMRGRTGVPRARRPGKIQPTTKARFRKRLDFRRR